MAFCKECGQKISEKAEVCPKCGVRQRSSSNKSKTTAILLAVFFSFWTWLYTYKKDAHKFWISLIINLTLWWILFIPPIIIYVWAIVDTVSKDENYYEDFE